MADKRAYNEEQCAMQHYLLSIYQPDGPMPAPEIMARIGHDLAVLRDELQATGAWVFAEHRHGGARPGRRGADDRWPLR